MKNLDQSKSDLNDANRIIISGLSAILVALIISVSGYDQFKKDDGNFTDIERGFTAVTALLFATGVYQGASKLVKLYQLDKK
ncbi:MAG: hypothetical protein ACRCXZ_08225 [Patescibacteria group bacterium]